MPSLKSGFLAPMPWEGPAWMALDDCRARLRSPWQGPHQSHGSRSSAPRISGKLLWAGVRGDRPREFSEVEKVLRRYLTQHCLLLLLLICLTYGQSKTHRMKAIFLRPFCGLATELESVIKLPNPGPVPFSQGTLSLGALLRNFTVSLECHGGGRGCSGPPASPAFERHSQPLWRSRESLRMTVICPLMNPRTTWGDQTHAWCVCGVLLRASVSLCSATLNKFYTTCPTPRP